ncbi:MULTISPECIES: shikimate dehydrogenase [unclassified Roseitalea]|uniref:shikimate dehydrogenase n=1 Tax=unclassified Roseitalea TaxID=2639107 RepID=UPI00273ED7CF|nr:MULTISPECIES: shikimate dehydrogenase [unclassified Roseitalea]
MAEAPRAFVVGHPIGHSRSPLIHRYWLRALAIAGSYEAVDVAPAGFRAFLDSLANAGWAGGNVTIPHKEAAFAALDRRDEAARVIGAVNTVWFEDGAPCAGNTDAYGFAANLDDFAPDWRAGARALVIGAGGASRAVIHALVGAGFRHVDLANRTLARAGDLAARFGASVHPASLEALDRLAPHADLIVNTTSLGMKGQPPLTLDLARARDDAIVVDIVYAPLHTPILEAARERGLTAVDGLGMLLHQAVPGFQRWFGERPKVDAALRAHIVADLARAGLA